MSQPDITLYDKYDYDYSKYWKQREYEHFAEVNALGKIMRKQHGHWFADFGGSYGRHIPLYYQRFHNCMIVDYSIKALEQARHNLTRNKIKNVKLVAANIYNLPLRKSCLDCSMIIRVLHHLEEPERAISEISRATNNKGTFIIEFANKHHIKAVIKALLRLDFRFLGNAPFKIESLGSCEGSSTEESGIIYNFNYGYLKRILRQNQFKIRRKYPISFLRIPALKKLLGNKLLNFCESSLQILLRFTRITPSIILETSLDTADEHAETSPPGSIEDLLCCPNCKSNLEPHSNTLKCTDCNISYPVTHGIYDMRYPIITE